VISSAFTRAIAQLPDPKFRSVLLRGVGITVVLLAVLIWVADWASSQIRLWETDWLNWLVEIASFGGVIVALFFLFPALASFFIALFLDDIAEAVENRHYPNDPAGTSAALGPSLSIALRFTVALIALNILVLPLYLIPGINLFLYYALNGYLLSREYFELVSLRHLDPKTIRAARKASRFRLFIAGVGIAFLMTVPIVNLIAPLVATAVMVHMFKGLTAKGAV
jgi:CysZ protein